MKSQQNTIELVTRLDRFQAADFSGSEAQCGVCDQAAGEASAVAGPHQGVQRTAWNNRQPC